MPNYAANTINVATTNFTFVGSPTPDYSMMSLGYDCDPESNTNISPKIEDGMNQNDSDHAESNTNMFSSTSPSTLDFDFDYPVLINVHISSPKIEDGVNQTDFFF
ncbi:23_t:CDS:2 [Ambispora gerdemannii]|uniref:23_t:CDS:1 n=1 Tax=Ambispora gerdemannii TaxID=144530 RepID=A0A9N8VX85_9GLOM|nr:23_t:CDS:2 [Ambispora gerdemannii]